jgi:hypothetical protein
MPPECVQGQRATPAELGLCQAAAAEVGDGGPPPDVVGRLARHGWVPGRVPVPPREIIAPGQSTFQTCAIERIHGSWLSETHR